MGVAANDISIGMILIGNIDAVRSTDHSQAITDINIYPLRYEY